MKDMNKAIKLFFIGYEWVVRMIMILWCAVMVTALFGLGFLYYPDVMTRIDVLLVKYAGQQVIFLIQFIPVGFLLLCLTTAVMILFYMLRLATRRESYLFPKEENEQP